MADRTVSALGGIKMRFVDMGDGTWAPVFVSASGEAQEVDLAGIGQPDDVAWNGTSPSASLISIMKACHAQLKIIADNTGV